MRSIIALALAALASSGCATMSGVASDPRDPLEPANRAVFAFNESLDRAVIQPVARGYRAVVPEVVRLGVTSFFGNLQDVWTGANNLLQGKFQDGVTDYARVLFNTTFGFGGVLDWASEMGLEKHDEDFGQTLGRWGLAPGPYIVLPLVGPSSVRDTAGFVADFWAYPPFWMVKAIKPVSWVVWRNGVTALDFTNQRTNALEATDILEQAALDRYSYVRSAFFQRRRNLIYDGSPPPEDESSVNEVEPDAASASAEPAADIVVSTPQTVEPPVPPNERGVLSAPRRP